MQGPVVWSSFGCHADSKLWVTCGPRSKINGLHGINFENLVFLLVLLENRLCLLQLAHALEATKWLCSKKWGGQSGGIVAQFFRRQKSSYPSHYQATSNTMAKFVTCLADQVRYLQHSIQGTRSVELKVATSSQHVLSSSCFKVSNDWPLGKLSFS